jgi:hypothetical protein
MVPAALNEACRLRLPDVEKLSPQMLGIDEHRFRSVGALLPGLGNEGVGSVRAVDDDDR